MNIRTRLMGVIIVCIVISRSWLWFAGTLGHGAGNWTLHLAVGLAFAVAGRVAAWLLILTIRTGMSPGVRCLWLVLALFDSALALALFAVQEAASRGAAEVRTSAGPLS